MGSDRADHVDYLVDKMRIVADFKGLQTKGFEIGSGPDLPNLLRGDPRILRQRPKTPMSGYLGKTPGSQCRDVIGFFGPKFEKLTAAGQEAQAFHSRLQITF